MASITTVEQELPTSANDVESAPIHNCLRLLRFDEIPRVCELLKQLTRAGPISDSAAEEFFANLGESQQVWVYSTQDSGVIAAATLLIERKLLRGGSRVGHIEDVVVDNTQRGLGLGKKLILKLCEAAKAAGCYKVILDCEQKNVTFYQRCGLEVKGIEMGRYF